ncbi:MAG: CBS domain-containing protein, partial [Nitrospinaceae bacterium]|nr:CBS domain-containing protein [Nitrospinaceae bacterium]NIR55141.1 CBS domain-containing protein [Nitrospinaceae bacterium]NIT82395.1 CBS domain-containing protein [Nitrospinaceae bacterium]NIW06198.1 CBS domain-containing protein [Nitrospinaceae bacterium]NIX34772.1 CBS domain-containing protein [Nitrospinaceae bacterium]
MDVLDELGDFMSSPVMRIDSGASVQEAALLMKAENVGSLIVEQYGEDTGIITEKDLTQKVLAKGKDPEQCEVTDVMTQPI